MAAGVAVPASSAGRYKTGGSPVFVSVKLSQSVMLRVKPPQAAEMY